MYLLNVNWFLCVFNQITIRRHSGKEKNHEKNEFLANWSFFVSREEKDILLYVFKLGRSLRHKKGMLKLPFLIIILLCIPYRTKVVSFCF